MTPVTNHDFTPEACADRLTKLLGQSDVSISLDGGGVEGGPLRICPEGWRLIHVNELNEILRHLTTHATVSPEEIIVKTKPELRTALATILEKAKVHRDLANTPHDRERWEDIVHISYEALDKPSMDDVEGE